MKETDIEDYLKQRVMAEGGRAYKFVSPGCSGVPDRIVILPGGRIGFLELKAPGEKPRAEQRLRMRQLRELGCIATWTDSKAGVAGFLARLKAENPGDINEYLTDILEAGGLI